jgi:hypothetical protein
MAYEPIAASLRADWARVSWRSALNLRRDVNDFPLDLVLGRPDRLNLQGRHLAKSLDFLSDHLPDHEPWRAWSNFEFIDDEAA